MQCKSIKLLIRSREQVAKSREMHSHQNVLGQVETVKGLAPTCSSSFKEITVVFPVLYLFLWMGKQFLDGRKG